MAFGACGGAPSASVVPASSAGSAGSVGAKGHLPSSFATPDITVAALVERDERVWHDSMRESGAAALLGPKLSTWLDDATADCLFRQEHDSRLGGRRDALNPLGAGPLPYPSWIVVGAPWMAGIEPRRPAW
jgi:hypothetical protein